MTRPALHRVLLVGAGVMGSHHARVLAESQRCDLVAVVDPAEHRGRALAARFGAEWVPEAGNLTNVDAVVVAASTDHHREIASEVLAEGIPLFVEKPLCASLSESREIVDTALCRGIPLMCGFIERFNPAVLEALSRAESPTALRMHRLSGYSPRMHAGVAWDLLVHDVDISLSLFSERSPNIIRAATGRFGGEDGRIGEDVVETVLEFSGARVAALSASRVSSRRARRMIVSERNRTIVADLLNPSVTIYSRPAHGGSSPVDPSNHDSDVIERIEHSGCSDPLAAQLEKFVDLMEGKADAGMEACSILPSHKVIAAILDSARESNGKGCSVVGAV